MFFQYIADAFRELSDLTINDPASLAGDDLLLVNARVKAEQFEFFEKRN